MYAGVIHDFLYVKISSIEGKYIGSLSNKPPPPKLRTKLFHILLQLCLHKDLSRVG